MQEPITSTNILNRFQSKHMILKLNEKLLEIETANVMDFAAAVGVLSEFFRTIKKVPAPPAHGKVVSLESWRAYH